MLLDNDLVEKNIPLVYHIIAHDYPSCIGDEDIAQSGLLGLVEAARRWKPTGSFSAYARHHIHREILNELKLREVDRMTVSLDQLQETGDKLW